MSQQLVSQDYDEEYSAGYQKIKKKSARPKQFLDTYEISPVLKNYLEFFSSEEREPFYNTARRMKIILGRSEKLDEVLGRVYVDLPSEIYAKHTSQVFREISNIYSQKSILRTPISDIARSWQTSFQSSLIGDVIKPIYRHKIFQFGVSEDVEEMSKTETATRMQRKSSLEKETFEEKLEEALYNVIEDSDKQFIIAKFKDAFYYKKQKPWLGEGKKEGLVYALHRALIKYRKNIKFEPVPQKPTKVDDKFKDDLRNAIQTLSTQSEWIGYFEKNLKTKGYDPKELGIDDIEEIISSSLLYYGIRKYVGTSRDPLW